MIRIRGERSILVLGSFQQSGKGKIDELGAGQAGLAAGDTHKMFINGRRKSLCACLVTYRMWHVLNPEPTPLDSEL